MAVSVKRSRSEGARPGAPPRAGAGCGEGLPPLDRHVAVLPVVQPVLAAVPVDLLLLFSAVQLTAERERTMNDERLELALNLERDHTQRRKVRMHLL